MLFWRFSTTGQVQSITSRPSSSALEYVEGGSPWARIRRLSPLWRDERSDRPIVTSPAARRRESSASLCTMEPKEYNLECSAPERYSSARSTALITPPQNPESGSISTVMFMSTKPRISPLQDYESNPSDHRESYPYCPGQWRRKPASTGMSPYVNQYNPSSSNFPELP